jgi:hypothetical protein
VLVRLRSPVLSAALGLSAVLLLSGCAGPDVIDVPASASGPVESPEAAPSATGVPTSEPLDCAGALPAALIEEDAGLATGAVVSRAEGDQCSYAVAGDDTAAVVLTLHRGPLVETFEGAGEAVNAVPLSLGTAAYWRQGLSGAPSELAVLAGGWEVRVASSVGDQPAMVDWAGSALASVGVPLTVA